MALPDVFCLFNRARGTELVSPDDLLAAVHLFPAIGAPLHLRTFASNVLVVQSNSHSDAEVGLHWAFGRFDVPSSIRPLSYRLAGSALLCLQHRKPSKQSQDSFQVVFHLNA